MHPGTYSGHPGPFLKCTRIYFGHTHSLIQYFLHHITWFRSFYQKINWQTVLSLHVYSTTHSRRHTIHVNKNKHDLIQHIQINLSLRFHLIIPRHLVN